MAKHQHQRSHATDNNSPYPYHDGMHRQSIRQKVKLVLKPNLRNGKNTNRIESRKIR